MKIHHSIFILSFCFASVKSEAQRICCDFLDIIAPNCSFQVIQDASPAGYYLFRGVEGCQYIFSHCSGGGSFSGDPYLTIADENCTAIAWNDDSCGLGSELTWDCPSTGFFQLHMGTFNSGCTALTRTLAYRINSPIPAISINTVSPICPGESIVLEAVSDFPVNWSPATGLSCNVCPNPSASPTASTTYTASTSNGCCSGSASITVVVKTQYNQTQNVSICAGSSFSFAGQSLTTSGTYTHVFEAVNQCDSTVTLNLSVVEIIPTISVFGGVITTPQPGFSYQWIDCDNGNAPVDGATSQFFVPGNDGNYAVQITSEIGCFGQSECSFVTGVEEMAVQNSVLIYPNPSSGHFYISADKPTNILITNELGQMVRNLRITSENGLTTEITGLAPGIYFVSDDAKTFVQKIAVIK